VGTDLDTLLRQAKVAREPIVDAGIRFVRRSHPQGHHYFLVNRGDRPLDGWVSLGTAAKSAVILDPRFADRTGVAKRRRGDKGVSQVYLQLQPGESCVLRTFTDKVVEGRPWQYFQTVGESKTISGTWQVRFVEGGPALPERFEQKELASWTERDDAEAK